ncbi:hypothetical protein B6U99_07015 [Candidatus Geothermarchaeota archaeon ex4572_27]|nr:MAG: hypothetical protein B6U99_07015 [Candidatus Geothermarchaeota archaeon ex4572_27]
MDGGLFIASDEEIKKGLTTDVYYVRTRDILARKGKLNTRVTMDVHAYSFPEGYSWAVLAGVEEVVRLLEGLNVDVYAMDEGTVFRLYEPVLRVEGPYGEFGIYETPILGILRHSSSIATKAARCKKAAGDRIVISFGVRAIHPAIAPMADRAAFIGGCDAVAGIAGAKLIGEQPVGTIPHELVIIMGDQVAAWKAFDEVMPPEVPRIALCDTWYDEIFGVGTSIMSPPSIDLSFDIVEVEGRPISKRGKMPGRKQVYRCFNCMEGAIRPEGSEPPRCPRCGGVMEGLLKPLMKGGRLVRDLPKPREIREYVLRQLSRLPDVA